MKIANKKWSESEFEQSRKEMLSKWPSGKEVDLEKDIESHKSCHNYSNAPSDWA